MNKFISIIMSLLFFSACGQTKNEKQDISNTKTDKHINIPGTKLYIIPPPDFKTATSFVGLQKGDNSVVQIYDLVGGNYYTNTATFNKNEFEKKGATVLEYKEIKVNNFPAKYIVMQTEQNSKTISLAFGDTTFSTMIMAIYSSTDTKTGEDIQKAIQTIYYDKNFKVDPFAAAAFTFDESKSIFKFSKSGGGMLMYSIGGVNKQSFNDEPFITVTTVPKDMTVTAKSLSEMSIEKLEQYGLTDKELKNISTENVNGQTAYEVEVYGKMQGKKTLMYVLVVTDQNKAITILGKVKSDFDNNLKEMKKLAKTIKLK